VTREHSLSMKGESTVGKPMRAGSGGETKATLGAGSIERTRQGYYEKGGK